MFGGAEMTRSQLQGADHDNLVSALQAFVAQVRDACIARGIPLGQMPFARPANFLVALNPDAIHLVVDQVPVGGMPEHTYLDRRSVTPVLPRDAIIGAAVRELGFREPIGVSLSLAVLSKDSEVRRTALLPIVEEVCRTVAEHSLVRQLNLPIGYEHFARFMPRFLQDHPDVERNVFLMMRFKNGAQYSEIDQTLRKSLSQHGFKVLRADDKDYTGDLWENVCLYMLGSRYGVAVFEEIDMREFNPNVALELGFMVAHNKRCLILKDQRMPRMPTDIVGKLYKEFDTYNIASSVAQAVEHWTRDVGLTSAGDAGLYFTTTT